MLSSVQIHFLYDCIHRCCICVIVCHIYMYFVYAFSLFIFANFFLSMFLLLLFQKNVNKITNINSIKLDFFVSPVMQMTWLGFFCVNGDHDESMMFLRNMVWKKPPIFLQLFLHRICIIMETCRNLGKNKKWHLHLRVKNNWQSIISLT